MQAIITGADGGMGYFETLSVAKAGYHVIMACYDDMHAEEVRQKIVAETGNVNIEIIHLDLADLASVSEFATKILKRGEPVEILMNNAGTLQTHKHLTANGLEWTVSVNYVGHYLLTRKLLPAMHEASRIVCMSSCSYRIGHIDYPEFFTQGRRGMWQRVLVYANTKCALTMFSLYLSQLVRPLGITVNVADPGVVDTDIIRLYNPLDYLTDWFYRPFINTRQQGATTAIDLMLSPSFEGVTGMFCKKSIPISIPQRFMSDVLQQQLWKETELMVKRYL